MKKTVYLLILLLLLVKVVAATWPTDYAGMRAKAITFAGRLLCLLEKATPYIILIFIVFGGLKYIMADDPGEILAARKMVLDAVVGGLCVLVFIAAAGALDVPVNCGDVG